MVEFTVCANARHYVLAGGVVMWECVAKSGGETGKRIDVITVVSTFLALISSNRDRRRVNIATLALS